MRKALEDLERHCRRDDRPDCPILADFAAVDGSQRDTAPASLYVSTCMPRLLSALLLALALLLSPLAMIGGAGAAHAATVQVTSPATHCPEADPAPQREKGVPGMNAGCAIACAALPATEAFTGERVSLAPWAPALLGDQLLSGIRPEGETPPPRIHPEI